MKPPPQRKQVAGSSPKSYSDKDELEDALITTARRPLFMRAYANYWANTGSVQSEKYTFEEYYRHLMRSEEEHALQTEVPAWLSGVVSQDKIWTIATMNKGQTPLLITGDSARNKFMVLPGGGYIMIEIKLPDQWDILVAPMGYEPLSHFETGCSD